MLYFPSTLFPKTSYQLRYARSDEGFYTQKGWHRLRHRFWAIDTASVVGFSRVAGKTYQRTRTTVGVYAPNTPYEEKFDPGQLNQWAWVLLEEKGAPSCLKKITNRDGFALLNDPKNQIRRVIQEIETVFHQESLGRPFLLSAATDKLIGVLLNLSAPASTPTLKAQKPQTAPLHPWRRIVRIELDRAVPQALKISTLSKILKISVSNFSHNYKANCGESFSDTVKSWRLEKAQILLDREELSIKEVATMLGFSHQSYLTSFLKKEIGISPSECRTHAKAGRIKTFIRATENVTGDSAKPCADSLS